MFARQRDGRDGHQVADFGIAKARTSIDPLVECAREEDLTVEQSPGSKVDGAATCSRASFSGIARARRFFREEITRALRDSHRAALAARSFQISTKISSASFSPP
jgi:hypothetical protein